MSYLNFAWHWVTQAQQWHGGNGIPARLLEHLYYVALTMVIAGVIALPFGLLIGHTGRGAFAVVSLANAARALPTLGLVILVAISVSASLAPVLIPLVALAIPPIMVNTYAGVRQVDPALRDAAVGMGMSGWQVLWRVEAPLALPLIVNGLRISAIQVVATATVAAFVGLGGLGHYIIVGYDFSDYGQVAGGTLVVVVLALAMQVAFTLAGRLVVSPGLRQAELPNR